MNSYGELINTLPDEGKKLIRIRESTIKKIINAELSITFNETCIRENLLPAYTLNINSDGAVSKARRQRPSDKERIDFMKTRVIELQATLNELREQRQQIDEQWTNINISTDLRNRTDTALEEILTQHRNTKNKANQKKLVNLNGGQLKQRRQNCGYINLTDKTLTPEQEELLNFGLNCHILSRPNKFHKRTECEILIEDINKLAQKGEVRVEPTFTQEIITESAKTRGKFTSNIVKKCTKKLRKL